MGKGNKTNLSISVALCTYNGERFIKEQLNSIINQFLPVNEIIICDDGSTDNTIKIIEDLVNNNPQIKFHINKNQKNLGVINNFAKAISLCSGDIIFLSDQDDIWMKEKTSTIIDYFNNHKNINCLFTNALIIDSFSKIYPGMNLFSEVCFNHKAQVLWKYGLDFEIINSGNRATGATMAIRNGFIDPETFFCAKSDMYHDEQLTIEGINNKSIDFITKPLIYYRIHENNTIGLGDNWLDRKTHNFTIKDIIHPCSLKQQFSFSSTNCDKYKFHIKRSKYIYSIKGRIILLFNLHKYIKSYKQFFLHFYIYDLFVGTSSFIKRKLHISI